MARGREDLQLGLAARGNAAGKSRGLRRSAGSFSGLAYFDLPYSLLALVVATHGVVASGSCAEAQQPADATHARGEPGPRRRLTMPRGLAVLIYHRVGARCRPAAAASGDCRGVPATDAGAGAVLPSLPAWPRGCDSCATDACPRGRSRSPSTTATPTTLVSHCRSCAKQRVPATFFIATSYLDGGRMWNDTVIEAVRRLAPGDHRFPHAGLDDHQRAPQP